MRYKIILLLLTTSLCLTIHAQKDKCGELGINLSGAYYLGDLNKIPFAKTRPSAGIFYRHTFDPRYAIRGTFNFIYLYANGKSSNIIEMQDDEFSQSVYDVNAVVEFNFIPYIPGNKKYNYSPYVFAGLGLSKLPGGTKENLFTIPFGVGIKYNLTEQITFSLETTFYKTFTDYIDSFYEENNNSEKQTYYSGNKDWFSVYGIKLAYKIKYKMKCPAFD